jgi:hypothetical protein
MSGGPGPLGTGGPGGPSGTGGALFSNDPQNGGFIDVGAGDMTTGLPAEDACRNVPVRPETIEITVDVEVPFEVVEEHQTALYLMLDRSTSMSTSRLPSGQNLWTSALSSVNQFIADPASAGLQVSLQYFPIDGIDYGVTGLPGPGCQGASGSPHDQPAVGMGLLPNNAGNLAGSLNNTLTAIFGLTPTEPALRGAVSYCATFRQQNPDWNCVAVFVTDGAPTTCNGDFNTIAGIAGQAKANDDVTTFAVGMGGADFNLLNAIATQGQGDCDPNTQGFQACDVTAGPAAFLDALRRIRETISVETRIETHTETQRQPLECEWGLPPPPEGEEFDPDKVNIQVHQSAGPDQSVGKVDSEAECAAHAGGWYYDNPAAPTRIKVCPQTCGVLQTFQEPTLDILLGCKSEPAILL